VRPLASARDELPLTAPHSFWKLGIPLCLFITAMFMWSDIVDAVDLVRKRLHSAERKLVRAHGRGLV
jgi:hypothetical protein